LTQLPKTTDLTSTPSAILAPEAKPVDSAATVNKTAIANEEISINAAAPSVSKRQLKKQARKEEKRQREHRERELEYQEQRHENQEEGGRYEHEHQHQHKRRKSNHEGRDAPAAV
jgi:ABC-type Zn2+ transport system substrate-binding protein/surface adhesin